MKIQNLTELLIDLRDFMDQVQSPKTPAISHKRDIEDFLKLIENRSLYMEVNFKEEKPEYAFTDGIYGLIYYDGEVKCMHSGTVQTGIYTWLKKIK